MGELKVEDNNYQDEEFFVLEKKMEESFVIK